MAAETASTPCEIIPAINDHAGLIDLAIKNATIPSNGILRLTRTNNTTTDVSIPYFLDGIVSGLDFTLDLAPNANRIFYTSGVYQINAQVYNIPSNGNVILSPGDITNPRLDIISLSPTNTLVYTVGIPAPSPVAPAVPSGHLKVLEISAAAGADGNGGYNITAVNIISSGSSIIDGNNNGQVTIWSNDNNRWEPTNDLRIIKNNVNFSAVEKELNVGVGYAYEILFAGNPTSNGSTSKYLELTDSSTINYTYRIGAEDTFNPFPKGKTETLELGTGFFYQNQITQNSLDILKNTALTTPNGHISRIYQEASDAASSSSISLLAAEVNSITYSALVQLEPSRIYLEHQTDLPTQTIIQMDSALQMSVNDGINTQSVQLTQSGLDINTALSVKVRDVSALTASFLVMEQNEFLLVINATNIPLIVLPANPIDGRYVIIKKTDSGNLDIESAGTETINLVATPYTLSGSKTSVKLVYVDSLNDWMIV